MTMIEEEQANNAQPGFPPHGVDAPQKITGFIQLIPSPKPDSHLIYYGPQDLGSRVFIAVTFFIFASVFSGVPLYFGIRDFPILLEGPFSQEGLIAAGALLIGIVFLLFFGREILWSLFGSTFLTASKQGLEIKRQFLFFTRMRFIKSDDIKCLLLHRKRFAGSGAHRTGTGSATRSSSWYTLWVVGRKKYKLVSKTPSRESIDWLSETLSEWFGVSCNRTR